MPRVQVFPVGPLETNCYLLSSEGQGILIDPGEDGDFLSEKLTHQNLTLEAILFTHAHFDHILGLLSLHLNFPQAPIYLNQADHFLYKKAASSAVHWVGEGYSPDPLPPVTSVSPTLPEIVNSPVLIPTPGHTPGSVCFYFPANNLLFSGDTLFKNGVGRTDLSYSDPNLLKSSLKALLKLPKETIVYPGHGNSTTIMEEHNNT